MANSLTAERLRELLAYDPNTGVFTWRVCRRRVPAGTVAGFHNARGVLQIRVLTTRYKAHRLAWLYMTGTWPKQLVDHKDCNPANNCWDNLREATPSQNRCNSQSHRPLPKGVYKSGRKQQPYASSIRCDGKLRFLGRFATAEQARSAYIAAASSHHGEFARF